MDPGPATTSLQEPPKTIELSDGSLFDFVYQTEFTVHTIAHSSAMACRFGGQCHDFYSVAQHGVLVSYIMQNEGGDPREGLLHDASEFVLLDMPTPAKELLPEYAKLEKDLLYRIRTFFQLPPKKTPECDRADKIAMFMEAYELIPSQGTKITDRLGVRDIAFELRPKYVELLKPLDWRAAKYQFLKRYMELSKR